MSEYEQGLHARTLELDFVCEDDCHLAIDEAAVHDIIARVLEEERITRPCMVSLSVVSEQRMHELNLEWRGMDRPTDVLSLECEHPNDPDLAPGEPAELGDIVLAPSYIARQASSFHVSEDWETTLLIVHATLHLLGYDHIEEEEALHMEQREDSLVALLTGQEAPGVRLTRHRGEALA